MELQIRLAGLEVSREQWLGEIALGHQKEVYQRRTEIPACRQHLYKKGINLGKIILSLK